MANRDYSDVSPAPKGRTMAPPKHPGAGKAAKVNEKPGYPMAGVPGKTGPNRSAGDRKVRQHPKDVGL